MSVRLAEKKVVVLGLGLTGKSCVDFLLKQSANVVVMDSREELLHELSVPVLLGDYDEQILAKAELIVISPGVNPNHPAIQAALKAGIEMIGDVELFARFNRTPVIAITGSNGKSTVTTLVNDICQAAGLQSLMGGNIGLPVLELLDRNADILVLELSSFQLETLVSLQPQVATILNVSEDHIDRHGTLARYHQAKQRIYLGAQQAVINRDDALTHCPGQQANYTFGMSASKTGFGWDENTATITFDGKPYLKLTDCKLTGSHNMLNIQAAAACAKAVGIDDSAIVRAAQGFSGLSHRYETISHFKNVSWINDSKATNVGATSAAILSFSSHKTGKLVLIAGGDGKGADFSPLKQLMQQYVDVLITFGKDGDKIATLSANSLPVANLKEAVQRASELVDEGDVVLLSPACASIDMFKNYQHRGDTFAKAVKELAA